MPGCAVRLALADAPDPRASISRTAGRASSPGVINLDVSRAVAGAGFYYAPDPSSQGVCSIGGNVAENSGGAHCLKYGFTTNHVLAARVVLSDGSVVDLGGPAPDAPGYDLLAALVGSEGMLGDRDRGDPAAPAQARGDADLLRDLPVHRRGGRRGLRHHRGGHPARRRSR